MKIEKNDFMKLVTFLKMFENTKMQMCVKMYNLKYNLKYFVYI